MIYPRVNHAISEIKKFDDIEIVLTNDVACEKYHLPQDRMGDIICMSSKYMTIGSSETAHDFTNLKEPLRSHGGLHEREVPFISNKKILEEFKNTNSPLYKFLLNKWYIDELYELLFVNPAKKIGSFFWKKGDLGFIDRFGPDGISKLIKKLSDKAGIFQTGFIYDYAFVMLIGLSILLTYLILN